MNDSLRTVPVSSIRDLDRFIRLPRQLYRAQPGFVAPLSLERRDALRRDKNPYFHHAEAQYWIVVRGNNEVVGRISAQIDRLYLERHAGDVGHFGFIDAVDDASVFEELTGVAEGWLRDRGMRRAIGPLNLSSNEECGLLIDGFGATPMMMMGFAPPYAGARLETLGYVKAKDLLAYDYDIPEVPPAKAIYLAGKLATVGRARIRPLDLARYDAELRSVIDIFNDAWSENWGFVPFTEAEMQHVAKSMRPLLNPELVWIGELEGIPACMVVCLPNLCEAIDGLDGRLLPFGWARLLWRLKVKGLKTGRVLLMGLRKRYQRSAAGTVLMYASLESLRRHMLKAGLERIELSWILEDNMALRRVIEDIGARPYKTYRIYEKSLV